jgi:UDP-glucose 4-epimerase
MTSKVLVTGAAGFIGSNLVTELCKREIVLDAVDDCSSGHVEFVPTFIKANNFYESDFSSEFILDKIKDGNYDVVYHLAAVPRVSYSVEHPFETNDINVTKTLALMDACRGNVRRFVFASSSSVYGAAEKIPTTTTSSKSFKSPYALQKSIIEDYLKLYYELYQLDSVCLRFFNVFGPNQLGDSPYSTAVSAWLTAIKKGVSMRSDGDGSQSRDMCYVDNVVDACIRAAQHTSPLKGSCFNVGCGVRTTNKEILEYLLSKFPDAKYHNAPWRSGDVMHTLADISLTAEIIGYKPVVEFWDGLDRTIEWYQKNWELINALSYKHE